MTKPLELLKKRNGALLLVDSGGRTVAELNPQHPDADHWAALLSMSPVAADALLEAIPGVAAALTPVARVKALKVLERAVTAIESLVPRDDVALLLDGFPAQSWVSHPGKSGRRYARPEPVAMGYALLRPAEFKVYPPIMARDWRAALLSSWRPVDYQPNGDYLAVYAVPMGRAYTERELEALKPVGYGEAA